MSIRWDSDQRAYVLKTVTCLPKSRNEVFHFFSDAFQLERITPPWLNFKILTPAPIEIGKGCLIDYRIRLRGIPIRWQTEISEWEPDVRFVDRQLRGPYQLWEHLHVFEDVPAGTLMTDEVRYRVPGGDLIHRLFVKNDLEKIFSFRQQAMLEIFCSDSGAGV
ncbi:MAG: SRPBCC family protein [Planctomyces sp.]|nr:SRPBCC family protein [Planctomyces sp.]